MKIEEKLFDTSDKVPSFEDAQYLIKIVILAIITDSHLYHSINNEFILRWVNWDTDQQVIFPVPDVSNCRVEVSFELKPSHSRYCAFDTLYNLSSFEYYILLWSSPSFFIFILNLPPNIPKIKIKFDWPVLTILRKWIISAWFQKFGVIILNGVTLKKKVMIWFFFLIQKDNKFACKISDYWKQNREGKSQRQLGLGCG